MIFSIIFLLTIIVVLMGRIVFLKSEVEELEGLVSSLVMRELEKGDKNE